MVQAVKDPMKTKGARLTTEISLPGRFVVYQPNGDGYGVSRRLDDDERGRLKDVLKGLDLKGGGVIVRTAAEGALAEDIERDLLFLQKLWKAIEARAKKAKPPTLLYQEAELPLRVTRDLFTENFEKAFVDEDRAYKRIVGYLKKTSPHMVERVVRYKEKQPLMEAYGVDAEIKSTLNRRVDLPSGGYLIFDYAEAFTVIDVNTGRFVGSRSRSSGARLEDTITKNNLEAVKEVVRQLRLRDIGGIIVIDFIDMANPKNRATVEEALRTELERDRTKTYVVEISPLGLVEMTRQNVTDGPREIMTKKCPTCGGDGIVLSETSAAVVIERRLRALAEGKREDLAPEAPVAEGTKVQLTLGEVGLHDPNAGVGKVDGLDVCVADAAKLVGKKVNVQVERVLDGMAYGTVVAKSAEVDEPITAEGEAEKPTRRAPAKKAADAAVEADKVEDVEEPEDEEPEAEAVAAEADDGEQPKPKKKTRRGSRGGRGRKKPAAAAAATNGAAPVEAPVEAKIHVPDRELGAPAEGEEEAAADGAGDAAKPKKKTRRGTRGGRNRKKKATTAEAAAPAAVAATAPAGDEQQESWEYVPMSEWGDEVRED